MKEKLLVVSVVALLATLAFEHLFPHTQAVQAQSSQSGRYTLLAAPFEYAGKSGNTPTHEILKIDTQTGQVWYMYEGEYNGKLMVGWNQIP
jgi:hypothetical protein